SADLYARAIIAAAISYGDDPVAALETRSGRARRCLAPAITGIARGSGVKLKAVCNTLGYDVTSISRARTANRDQFQKAQDAAEEAVRYAIRTAQIKAANAPPTAPEEPSLKTIPEPMPGRPTRARSVASMAEVRQRQVERNAQRLSMKGRTSETRHDGVQVIRVKPITDAILAWARQQLAKGVTVEDFADLFEVDAEALERALGREVAA
ncbi:hypothetical protein, partial [Phenylobacterium sp.]|uniref:hypothetical protein n=1 Tax=Phenylobacterium sp. TaxID=1871053 RepID=UPI0019C6E160